MDKVLNIKQVAEAVAEHLFDHTKNLVTVAETSTSIQLNGFYCGLWASVSVAMGGPMMIIQANTIDDHNGYTLNFPLIPEDATEERINKHMTYALCEW